MRVAFTLHKPVLKIIKKKGRFTRFLSFLLFFLVLLLPANLSALIVSEPYHQKNFAQLITSFSSVKDRSSGSIGAIQTAEFIKSQLKNLIKFNSGNINKTIKIKSHKLKSKN